MSSKYSVTEAAHNPNNRTKLKSRTEESDQRNASDIPAVGTGKCNKA